MKPFVAQWIAAMTANLGMLNVGLHHGWSSPTLPKLLGGEDELRLTKDEASWTVSLASVGCIFGPILVRLMVDRAGRKRSLMSMSLPLLASWIIIGLATDAVTLYIGRFVGGIGNGAIMSLIPMYVGEIADDNIRGALGTLLVTMMNAGMLMAYIIGPWVSRQTLAVVAIVPIFIYVIMFIFVPETPYFYLLIEKEEEAEKSLRWLKQNYDVSKELEQMKICVQKQQLNKGSFWELVRAPGNRRGLILGMALLTYHQFSGITAILSYASQIFDESGFVISASVSVIIMGLMKLLVGTASFFVIDRLGRKLLLIVSATLTFCMLMLEAIFFNLKYNSVDISGISWLPLFGILGFCITYTFGIANVPVATIAEVFPINVKAPGNMVIAIYAAALTAIIAKIYQLITTKLGVHVAFYGFAAITITCVPFTYFFLPEMKGQSLQDIQDTLNGVSADDISRRQSRQISSRPNA